MNQATATEFSILEQYGETETTLIDLDQLQNINERADTYYSRFYTLLRQIAKAQPKANTAMLDLLARSIEEAELTVDALNASIQEIKQDWNIL
jgi:thiamine biosynthesis lipoprotein ApbE